METKTQKDAADKGNQESDLRPLLFPEAIAVVGASRREEAIGRKVVTSFARVTEVFRSM